MSIREKVETAEREAAELRTILTAYPDVEDYSGLLSSASVRLVDCTEVDSWVDTRDQALVRFGRVMPGATVWTHPVTVEALLMRLIEDPQGGPALARVFAAMRDGQ